MNIDELFSILLSDNPSERIKENEEEIFKLIPELKICKGFNQNNPWHIYDVYEHILHVIDNVDNNIVLRLCALFHDIGKPVVYTEDEKKIGHFYNHWIVSQDIFNRFSSKYNLDNELTKLVSNLIFYHDLNISKLNQDELNKLFEIFSIEQLKMLFEFKKADLLAQNKEYHYLLDDIEKQRKQILSKKKEFK